MLNHPARATWGKPRWGDVVIPPAASVRFDGVARATLERAVSVDGVAAALAVELSVLFDNVALLASSRSVSFDVYQARLPSVGIRDGLTFPLLLVELDLPAGPVRVAPREVVSLGVAWDGRLVQSGSILRSIGAGTDDLRLVLDDTATRGPRFRDLFRANDPEGSEVRVWLMLEGEPSSTRLLVFEGAIEQVGAFSDTTASLEVVRFEAVKDQTLGRPLTLTDFPDAPDESLAQTIPLVFGFVPSSPGLVIDTNAIGKLSDELERDLVPGVTAPPWVKPTTVNPTPPWATGILGVIPWYSSSVNLEDASAFPIGGVVQIGQERIAYSTRLGNSLTHLTRGYDGTPQTRHSKGSTVIQVGTFAVKFADHRTAGIQDVRFLTPAGNLGEPVPAPALIDNLTGEVSWDEQPRVRDQEEEAQFQRVGFGDPGPANQVSGARFAARESKAYRAFGVAQLQEGTMELLTNTEDLDTPGDILQVYIGTVFDPKTLAPKIIPSWQDPRTVTGIPGAAWIELANGTRYNLLPWDTIPDEIARRDEKTGDRLYDVPDPVVEVQIGEGEAKRLTPTLTEDPGLWVYDRIADRVRDGDEETEAVYLFIGIGEVLITGNAPAYFSLRGGASLGADDYVTKATLCFAAGWDLTPTTSAFEFGMTDDTTGAELARGTAATAAPSGFSAGYIRKKETFCVEVGGLGEKLEKLPDVTWFIDPIFGVHNGLWVGRELWLEVETERRPPETDISLDPKGSVTNYFDVTEHLGIDRNNRDPAREWAWFTDLMRGGLVRFKGIDPATFDPQILETFWVVKYRPFLELNASKPQAFADVWGYGFTFLAAKAWGFGWGFGYHPYNAARFAEMIVTNDPPYGLGLGSDRISRPDYNRAAAWSSSYFLSFTLTKPTSAIALLERIAAESDLRQTWDQGRHRLIPRAPADTLVPVFRELKEEDVLRARGLAFKRTGLEEVRTRFAFSFRTYGPTGDPSRSLEVVDLPAEAKFGRRSDDVTLLLVQQDSTAQGVMALRLQRERRPRWVVSFDIPLYGLELRFGDLVSLEHRDFSFRVGEVVGLTLETQGLDRIQVEVVVWLV